MFCVRGGGGAGGFRRVPDVPEFPVFPDVPDFLDFPEVPERPSACSGGKRKETDYGAGRVCFAVRSAGACGISCVNAGRQGK